jgi:hypothetical protein
MYILNFSFHLALLIFALLVLRICYKVSGQPDFIIGGADNPYMLRWWILPRNMYFNIYLHKIMRDDDDRALHDHPWWNVSVLLRGAYREITPDFRDSLANYGVGSLVSPHTLLATLPQIAKVRGAGSIVFRRAACAHRLEVVRGPVWSLFITGRVRRRWGFHCAHGWRYWKEFTAASDPGAVGRGCD